MNALGFLQKLFFFPYLQPITTIDSIYQQFVCLEIIFFFNFQTIGLSVLPGCKLIQVSAKACIT